MFKSIRCIDVVIVAMTLTVIATPLFAVVVFPSLGAAAFHVTLDARTENAAQARSDFATAFNYIGNQPCTSDLTLRDLNNQRLTSGVYCFNSSTLFNGWYVLDGQGDPNAIFIFKLTNTFTIADATRIILTNGVQPKNIFWHVSGPIRIGTGTWLSGTFMASGDIMVGTENTIEGRLLSFGVITRGMPNTIVLPSAPALVPQLPQPAPQPTPFPTSAPQPALGGATLVVSHLDPSFVLFVNGIRVPSGIPVSFAPGAYTVSEINLSSIDYAPPVYSGDCAQNGFNATVTLKPGDQKTCFVSNIVSLGEKLMPGFPNAGGGGAYLPFINLVGIILVGAFGWQELRRF